MTIVQTTLKHENIREWLLMQKTITKQKFYRRHKNSNKSFVRHQKVVPVHSRCVSNCLGQQKLF